MTSTNHRVDGADVETLVRRVIDIIASTRTIPLSSSVKLDNRDEVLEMLEEACARLPEELRQARWMLKEREEYLERQKRDGEDILESARVRAERMVQRTEIVREAQMTARHQLDQARDESARMRHEADDYCDQKLAGFEIVLERIVRTVHAGRDKLAVTPTPVSDPAQGGIAGVEAGEDSAVSEETFFDQDRF